MIDSVQLFGGRFIERKFPGTPNIVKSRMNFDSFFNSFFSCFQVTVIYRNQAVLLPKSYFWAKIKLVFDFAFI